MSYCVNCGVDLGYAEKCPLCDTPVIHRENEKAVNTETPFSQKVVIPRSSRRRFTAYIISMVMLIPNIVCLLANFIFDKGHYWSLYIGASTALVWVLLVLPFYTKKLRPYFMWAFDSIAVAAYVYFFFAIENKDIWFVKCALPVIGAISLFSLIYIIWYRHKKRETTEQAVHLVADMILCSLVVGAELSYYNATRTPFYISLIIAVSLLAIFLFLVCCNSSKRMKAWLSRNFFTE